MQSFCLKCGAKCRGSYCRQCRPRNGSTRQGRKLRERVLARDRYVCQIRMEGCTGHASHADHIVPVKHGGKTILGNLQAACESCNLKKGSML